MTTLFPIILNCPICSTIFESDVKLVVEDLVVSLMILDLIIGV